MISTTTSDWTVQPAQFRAYHGADLEHDEVRHGLILNALAQVESAKAIDLSCWTLGGPGECAIKMGHHSIVLGALAEDECRRLADWTADMDYPGVIGPEMTARWFTDRARELRLNFLEPEPQQIYSISHTPRYPGAPGSPRFVGAEDAPLLADWLVTFYPKPSRVIAFRLARNSNGVPVKVASCSGPRTANRCPWRESCVA